MEVFEKDKFYERVISLCGKSKQVDIESGAGVSHSNISKWKTSAPRLDTAAKLASYLGVSLDYLAFGENSPSPAAAPAPARAAAVADVVPMLSDSGFGLSAEEMTLLKGFRVASGPVRKIMLDAARDALKGEVGERLSDSEDKRA
jgi:transcriptional regulator with XRE-family HTH domain